MSSTHHTWIFKNQPGFQVKKNSKNFVVWGQQWEKNINAQINFGAIKKGE